MASIEVGRVCVKIAGREAGEKCAIVEIIDENFVEVIGEAVKNRRCNIAHLEPTADSIDVSGDAESIKGAKGLMQLMHSTAEDVAKKNEITLTEENILEPEINIKIGTIYISTLIRKYECIEVALAAYNAGSGNIDKWIDNGTINADGSDIENIPFKETNNYVRKIMRDYKIYNEL